MPDRLKQIPARLLEIWKKYTKKQRTIILSIIGAVVLALIILILLLGKTTYVTLDTFDDIKTAKDAVAILEQNGINYKIDSDKVTVLVDAKQEMDASYSLVGTDVGKKMRLSLTDLLENDMSTTNGDKKLKSDVYLQSRLETEILEQFTGIDDASVIFRTADSSNTILNENKEIKCLVSLKTNSDFNKKQASAIAESIATALGNSDTRGITIMNQSESLFYGLEEKDDSEDPSEKMAYRKELTNFYENMILMAGINAGYSSVTTNINLDIIFDTTSIAFKEFVAADGQEQGLMDTFHKISSEGGGTTNGGIPGSDGNDEVDYYLPTGNTGASSYDEQQITYKPSERLTNTLKSWGAIVPENSSMAIVLKKTVVQTEKELTLLGMLGNMTFEEYVARNKAERTVPVTPELLTFFSMGTGIPESNISIILIEVPEFIANPSSTFNWQLVLGIVLAVLIAGLLIFVVFRGMKPVEVAEIEEELSVTELLATTKENQSLDDIEFSEKSETRRMIEKFVEENPDAVAQLLRNWLNDEYN